MIVRLAAPAAALLALAGYQQLNHSSLPHGQANLAPRTLSAQVEPVVDRLEDRFPNLPPEVLRSLDEESYVLDRMTVRPAMNGGQRVVAPVSDEAGGAVFITF